MYARLLCFRDDYLVGVAVTVPVVFVVPDKVAEPLGVDVPDPLGIEVTGIDTLVATDPVIVAPPPITVELVGIGRVTGLGLPVIFMLT